MNEPNSFTFLINKSDESYQLLKMTVNKARDITIYTDVPKDSEPYVKYSKFCQGGTEKYNKIHIHIHDPNDIEGGGWNHGKFGRGITISIQ